MKYAALVIIPIILLSICAIILNNESFRTRLFHPGYWLFLTIGGEWDDRYYEYFMRDRHRDEAVKGLSVGDLKRKYSTLKSWSEYKAGDYKRMKPDSSKGFLDKLWFKPEDQGFGWAIEVHANPDKNEINLIKG